MSRIAKPLQSSPYVAIPKILASAPLSLAAKGLLFELLLNENSDKLIGDEYLGQINELLSVGFLSETQIDNKQQLQLTDLVHNYQAHTKSETVVAIPVFEEIPQKPYTLSSKDNKITFGKLYDCLLNLPFKGKLPKPNYHKLRAQILHWLDHNIAPEHIEKAHSWLALEKGNVSYINWWEIDGQIWEVKALTDRQKESETINRNNPAIGVNGHLCKHNSGSAFLNNINQTSHDIQSVFAYWQSKTQMRGELTLERIRVIRSALESFTAEDLGKAVDGALANDYCVGRGLLSVQDIYRSTDIIAKHIHLAENPYQNRKLSPAEQAIDIALNDITEGREKTTHERLTTAKK